MSGILPQTILHAVSRLSTDAASTSFGLVAFAALVAVLLHREALGSSRPRDSRLTMITAVSIPLAVTVAVMLAVRVLVLAQ